MLLLGLDTATPTVTVAVGDGATVLARRDLRPGETGAEGTSGGAADVPVRRRAPSPRHGELLAPAVRDVLAEAGVGPGDLTHVVCGVGPGPFTGVRVGVVTARVLGLTLGVPVVGVCSLDGLAAAAGSPCLAVIDARRREVYVAAYDAAGHRTWGPRVVRPGDLPALLATDLAAGPGSAPRLAVGPGAQLYAEVLAAAGRQVGDPAEVEATTLVALAAARLAAGEAVPDLAPYVVSEAAGDGRDTVVPDGLLAPEPLYLRRPDAVPSVTVRLR